MNGLRAKTVRRMLQENFYCIRVRATRLVESERQKKSTTMRIALNLLFPFVLVSKFNRNMLTSTKQKINISFIVCNLCKSLSKCVVIDRKGPPKQKNLEFTQ